LLADPPSNETIDVFYIKKIERRWLSPLKPGFKFPYVERERERGGESRAKRWESSS